MPFCLHRPLSLTSSTPLARSLGDQAHAQLAGGGTTSEALTLAALQQQRTSAALNAYTTTTHEAAARAALESDQRRAAGMRARRPTGEIFVCVFFFLSLFLKALPDFVGFALHAHLY
jgi:hypothetical protein